jgi:DNA-binding CsgD family transcriptional regulator
VGPDLVEALLTIGDYPRARAVVDRLRTLADRQAHPWARVSAAQCDAFLRLATGPYDEHATAEFVAAIAAYEELGLRFDAARAALRLGRAQRRHRKWGASRRSLERAAVMFDELGSPGWVEQARSGLSRVGAGQRSPDDALTPSERRAAALAARGHSNREIARTLHVTVHTVEAHLGHVYAKLGVRSRTQLVARLASR